MAQTRRFLVYIASNHNGLDSERYEVSRQLARMGILTCGFPCREDTSPYDWNLVRSQIEDADLFLMILGDEYGPMAPTGISYLHREYVHAQSLSKPVISYVKNALNNQPKTEDERRLAGFHGVLSKDNYRLWHLCEGLIAHVKTSVASTLSNNSGGWMKIEASAVSMGGANTPEAPVAKAASNLTSQQMLAKSRQLIQVRMSAKVYEAGNNTLDDLMIPQRSDMLFYTVAAVMKQASSEDRLRSALEKSLEAEVKKRLLVQHPSAHAVDDIRVDRNQFSQLLKVWQELGFISFEERGRRQAWQLTDAGVKRLAVSVKPGQAV